jgi:hypothetical protein
VAGQRELMLDVQQALPGEGVQEVVELVLGFFANASSAPAK